MIDLGNTSQRSSLWTAMRSSHLALQPFREKRRRTIENYVGSEWGAVTDDRKVVLVNILALTARTYMMSLAANRPQILVTADDIQLKAFAKKFEVGVNNVMKEIQFERTLRKIVLDAFFSIGIAKVYWADSEPVEVPNPEMPPEPGFGSSEKDWADYQMIQELMSGTTLVDPGQPFVERVSLDDYIYDTQATAFTKARFHCHEYRVPLSAVKKDERFDRKVVEKLVSDSKWSSSAYGSREQRTEELIGETHDHDELEPMVTLIDTYLPFENKWAVMSDDSLPPLFVDEWNGPEGGPFKHLCFDEVPDNAMPMAPAQNLRLLHQLMNSVMRKQARQANRQKDVTTYQGDIKDANAVRQANDGDTVRVNDPNSINVLKYGGVDQMNMAFYQVADGIYNRMAGNLDAMAGLGPQSKTATQDQLINDAVSESEARMQYAVVEFVADVGTTLGQMMWADEMLEVTGSYKIPGLSKPVDANWTPEMREGDVIQYQFNVEPHSMAYKAPSARLQSIGSAIQMLAPAIQAGTVVINGSALAQAAAELLNEPRILDVIQPAPPPDPMMQQGGGPGPGGSPNSPTHNIRENISTGGTPDSQRMQMAQQFSANAAQGGGAGG
tara:strand:- start:7708 stop:9540 length:1833 start_codon:yes stop_codon:yes gene_type:complete